MHMIVSVAQQITVAGHEDDPWILHDMYEAAVQAAEQMEGYPWIIVVEQETEVLTSLKSDPRPAFPNPDQTAD
eukprot:1709319-Karenia_brevis.AAC.1